MQSWGTYDSRGRSLYLRPSDGELVYLECCVAGCGKTNFKNIRSIMCHVSDMRIHGGGKGFFRDHAHVIEVCGKLPPERQALREGEEGQRLIEPYPHQEQIAYGSEPSIPVSSLRQSATTHAIEQDFAGLSSPEAPSIRGPPISDYSSVSATPTMETHDVTVRKEVLQRRWRPTPRVLCATRQGRNYSRLLVSKRDRESRAAPVCLKHELRHGRR